MKTTWDKIGGHYNWQWLYEEMAERLEPGDVAVEVDVWLGRSICHLASMTQSGVQVYGVDLFRGEQDHKDMTNHVKGQGGSFLSETARNITACGLHERINLVQADSVTAAGMFSGTAPRFVYIDACHDYESVLADIQAWLDVIVPWGVIAGHDWSAAFPGVEKAVRECFEDDQIEVRGSTWKVEL